MTIRSDEQRDGRTPPVPLSRSIRSLAIFMVFLGVALFLPAGDLRWGRGRLFFIAFVVWTIISVFWLRRVNPDIFTARSRVQEGTKRWDRVVMIPLLLSLFGALLVSALDGGRFHWTNLPPAWIVFGHALLLCGYAISAWAYAVNKFAEPGVRIQKERGQTVIDTGPYAFMRHPVYLGGILVAAGMPLALGSVWGLVPAACATLTLAVRVVLEERTLRAELPGYAEYSRRVRYRLIPGIW